MRPRRSRWLSIPDVTDIVLQRSNKVAERLKKLPRRYQVQYVRRMVKRAERRDEARLTKRVSGDIYVRFDAVETLLPVDVASLTSLEVGQAHHASQIRKLWRTTGGQGATLRDHAKRLSKVEKKAAILAKAQADLAAVDLTD